MDAFNEDVVPRYLTKTNQTCKNQTTSMNSSSARVEERWGGKILKRAAAVEN